MIDGIYLAAEAATRGVLQKKVFLKITQNLQENTCAGVSFLTKLHAACNFIKRRLQHRYLSVNFAKYLGTLILQNTSERLLL